jgi:hypothetical protein
MRLILLFLPCREHAPGLRGGSSSASDCESSLHAVPLPPPPSNLEMFSADLLLRLATPLPTATASSSTALSSSASLSDTPIFLSGVTGLLRFPAAPLALATAIPPARLTGVIELFTALAMSSGLRPANSELFLLPAGVSRTNGWWSLSLAMELSLSAPCPGKGRCVERGALLTRAGRRATGSHERRGGS